MMPSIGNEANILGDAYHYAGQNSLAEPCYVEALSIYRGREDRSPLDLANAIRSFAVLKTEIGATEEAERLWCEAHDLYVLVDVPAGIAGSAADLALLAQKEGKIRQRDEWLAIAISTNVDDAEVLQHIQSLRARIKALAQ